MTTTTTPTQAIADNTVILKLCFRKPGNTRKANLDRVETQANKRRLKLQKEIFSSPEYDRLGTLAGQCRRRVAELTLPSPLGDGTYLVPLSLVERVNSTLDLYAEEYQQAGRRFAEAYPSAIATAEWELADQYNRSDYTTAEAIGAAVRLERQFLDLGTPSPEKIGLEIWQREQAKAEETWKGAIDEIREGLREAFAELIGNFAERLKPSNGKKRVFKDATLDNVNRFLDVFEARNLTNDAELSALVAQAKEVLAGRSANAIRRSPFVKEQIRQGMRDVAEKLTALVEDAPTRKLSFDE